MQKSEFWVVLFGCCCCFDFRLETVILPNMLTNRVYPVLPSLVASIRMIKVFCRGKSRKEVVGTKASVIPILYRDQI